MLAAFCRRRAAFAFCLLGLQLPTVAAQAVSTLLPQSFFFDWNPPAQTFPVPYTEQCDTIKIIWARGTATGPNPVPPYHLQVYTSLFLVPVIIPVGMGLSYDWTVPFPPGTLYQICMFDSNGNTGGCQDTYTVIPSSSDTPVTCTNATLPTHLDVEGIVKDGPISRYGWIEECTDIQLTPKNGTPPYFLTVAPALHPPFNMSGPGPFNWTVELSWGSPFFIGMSDSAGNMWSHGLLHAGGPGDTSCLAGKKKIEGSVPAGAAAGAGVGGFIIGALGGLGAMFFYYRKRKDGMHRGSLDLSSGDEGSNGHLLNATNPYNSVGSQSRGLLSSMGSHSPNPGHPQYHVEPFVMPVATEDGRTNTTSSPATQISRNPSSEPTRQDKVYVVHHDGNAAPVTIYHEDGTEIVELPPRYPEGSAPPLDQRRPTERGHGPGNPMDGRSDVTSRSSETAVPGFLQQQRRPDRPGKQRRPPPNDGPLPPSHGHGQ